MELVGSRSLRVVPEEADFEEELERKGREKDLSFLSPIIIEIAVYYHT